MSRGLGAHYYRYTENPITKGEMSMNYGSGLGEVSPQALQMLGQMRDKGEMLHQSLNNPQQHHYQQQQQQSLGGDIPPQVYTLLAAKMLQNPNIVTELGADIQAIGKATATGDKEAIKKFNEKYGKEVIEIYAMSQIQDPVEQQKFIQDYQKQSSQAEGGSNTMMYVSIGGAILGAGALYYFMFRKPKADLGE